MATYYVDFVGGSDANAGTSTGTAWKHSPGMAGATGTPAGTTPAAGDIFYFKKGVTWPATALPLTIVWSGTSGNPITWFVTDWGTGNHAIFDAQSTDLYAILSYSYSYNTLNGIDARNPAVQGTPPDDIYYYAIKFGGGGALGLNITNCKTLNGSIFFSSTGGSVKDCVVDFGNVSLGEAPAIEVMYSSNVVISGNDISNFTYCGIKTGGEGAENSSNVTVEKNFIHSPGSIPTSTVQAGIILRDSTTCTYRYNVIDLHPASAGGQYGMVSWNSGGSNKIYNNTIVMNGTGDGFQTSAQSGNIFRNNIVYNPGVGYDLLSGTGDVDYGTVYSATTEKTGTWTWGANNLTSDPTFVDVTFDAVADFQLQAASPMIGAGVAYDSYHDGVNTDYWGTTTPQGASPDIGAHEVAGAGPLTLIIGG